MATATSSVASAGAPPTANQPTSGRPQLKSSNSSSGPNRRSTQSPLDGPQRRNTNKAWQTNTQQKFNATSMPPSSSSSPTPGQAAGMRSRTPNSANGGETDTHDKHMHDRTLFALAKMMGKPVIVTVKGGAQYTGTLTGANTKTNELGVSLKWVKLHKAGDDSEKEKEGQNAGGGPENSMVIEPKDFMDLRSEGVNLDAAAGAGSAAHQNGGFKTDADISGNYVARERELRKWQPDEAPSTALGLEESSSGGQGWDQFAVNEKMFNVVSTYDENIYTTTLDRSNPKFAELEAKAAKIAAEIEGQASSSAHIAEERGLAVPDDSGMDEEDKYSGVQRTPAAASGTNVNRYTPPARRAPTGNPTVPGAPHDPAIISSQLARPETLQKQASRQPTPQQSSEAAAPQKPAENTPAPAAVPLPKPKERPALPAELTSRATPSVVLKPGEAAHIEKDLSLNFKNFVTTEKERVKKKRSEMASRDRESKLRELKKFSESFTLKTEVPSDLVPILAKDKQKQAEIIEKSKQGASKAATAGNTGTSTTTAAQPAIARGGVLGKQGGKVLPADSFAAKDPERFQRETQALLQSIPRNIPGTNTVQQQQGFGRNVQAVHQDRNRNVRAPMPLPEQARPPFAPTGPANHGHNGPAQNQSAPQKRLNVNARPFEYKPNPNAVSFTPTFSASPATAAASPAPAAPAHPRAPSPSLFFGNKRIKTSDERPSIKDHFNPFVRMKLAPKPSSHVKHGNANDYIEKPFATSPLWQAEGPNEKLSYTDLFGKVEFDPSGAPPAAMPHHMMPPQHHQHQMPAPHNMPHMAHNPHMPHQPPHGPVQGQHLGIPPHYDQDHLRQMSSPSSVMPSPSMHHATIAPYQQSPVPHAPQLAMYPGGQGAMHQYGVGPGGPGPQFGYYQQGGFRPGQPGAPMMVPGPNGPVPFQPGQFMHPQQMYSPQQHPAYIHTGPPPAGSQGFPSPGPRPAAPMMMHQGSSQGTAGAPMVPYGMQPNQNGPVYGAQGQQQSEFPQPGQNWPPQRSQSTVPFSSSAVSSPRMRHKPVPAQTAIPPAPGTPTMLSPALAAFASPALAPAQPYTSQPLQRSQSNKPHEMSDGGAGRGNGNGRGGRGRGGYNGRGRGHMANPHMQPPGAPAPINPGFYNNMDSYSNDPAMNTVGMMRGQPPPPHQGGPPPGPPPHFYQGHPQGHYPQQGGRGYGGPHQQHMPHPPPPPQQMQQPGPPPPQQQQQQNQQPPAAPAAQQSAQNAQNNADSKNTDSK